MTTTTRSTTTTIPDHWVKIEKCRLVPDQSSKIFTSVVVCEEEFVDPESKEGKEWQRIQVDF